MRMAFTSKAVHRTGYPPHSTLDSGLRTLDSRRRGTMKSTLPPKPRTPPSAVRARPANLPRLANRPHAGRSWPKQYGISQSRISQLICRVWAFARTPHQAPCHHAPAAPTLDLGPETFGLWRFTANNWNSSPANRSAWRQENKTVTQNRAPARFDMPMTKPQTKTPQPNLQCLSVAVTIYNLCRERPL